MKIRHHRKSIITQDQWEQIQSESFASKDILEGDRYQFIRDYLFSALEDAETKILENRIAEVREETIIDSVRKKIFIIPQKVQVDELVGAYKWIKRFVEDLETFATRPDKALKDQEKGMLIIETSNEK